MSKANIPYFNGRICVQFAQINQFLNLHGDWSSDYDPSRKPAVVYRNKDHEEGLPLSEAFAVQLQTMIGEAKREVLV